MKCPILEFTADNVFVGRCCHHLPDGETCPRHGDVSIEVAHYVETGKCTPETIQNRIENMTEEHRPLMESCERLLFACDQLQGVQRRIDLCSEFCTEGQRQLMIQWSNLIGAQVSLLQDMTIFPACNGDSCQRTAKRKQASK